MPALLAIHGKIYLARQLRTPAQNMDERDRDSLYYTVHVDRIRGQQLDQSSRIPNPRFHARPRSVGPDRRHPSSWPLAIMEEKEQVASTRGTQGSLISSYAGLLHLKPGALLLEISMNTKACLIVWAMTPHVLIPRRGPRIRVSSSPHTCGIRCFVYSSIFFLPSPDPVSSARASLLTASTALSLLSVLYQPRYCQEV